MRKQNNTIFICVFLFMMLSVFTGCTSKPKMAENMASETIKSTQTEPQVSVETVKEKVKNSVLNIYFIDVGQGDACLLEQDGHFMLIDAGDNDAEQTMVDFLNEKSVQNLDYVVGTHPHADHIGGLDAVIDAVPIDKIYMPKVEANTKTFEDVLDALDRQNLQVNTPDAGTKFLFANTVVEILAPIQYHEDLNNNSIVLRVIYEDNTFLFTGDMEEPEEFDVINSGYKLYADLLKIGHHGSDTSTSQAFLDKVNPQCAIISVGTGNSYGHPTEATLERLNRQGTDIYRTDLNGDIHVSSNGNTILVENTPNYNSETTQKSENVVENQSQEFNYIGNKNSKKFHLSTCYTLPSEKNRVQLDTIEEALELGFQPCKNCNP